MKHPLDRFASLKVDESWTYAELKRKDITYLTNSYHRYPAKFIPQLVSRLIREYSNGEELICDPFVGGGTTLVEGLIAGRRIIGVDINPIAYLISKAKTTWLDPKLLKKYVSYVFSELNSQNTSDENCIINRIKSSPNYERIKFWFNRETILDLSLILSTIEYLEDENIKTFFKCGFSHILKNCSRWHMNCIKPIRDKNKRIAKAIPTFKKHIKHMMKKNKEFYKQLPDQVRENIQEYAKVFCCDCRYIPVDNDEVSLIVTSPPYVVSYSYANLHQLSVMWLMPEIEISELGREFIGTKLVKVIYTKEILSEVGNSIVEELEELNNNNRYARSVFTYFVEMQQSLEEFHRILKPNGVACIVIGNTTLAGVDILNAEVLTEMAINKGFRLVKVIKRRVPNNGKFLPSVRDPRTGYFISKKSAEKKKLAYPCEYILILSKRTRFSTLLNKLSLALCRPYIDLNRMIKLRT